ncbi:uncharacterized protein [Fopius arisanus]|uniref:XRCC4 coiled-coil domain-containing protein n=1 Tax=Fopius arisanus TaxID=64838 RepID=A0A9R1U2G8_9HYME|nr:PREDICTED: uncharacterized protein LOC105267519 [Fopius arisanus]
MNNILNSRFVMDNLTTACQVRNSLDKEFMTLLAKWDEKDLQILILRKGSEPLKGEICIKNLLQPAGNFSRTDEQYLEDIKRELAGEDEGVEFSIKVNTFQWKKKAWKRGLIECQHVNNIVVFSDLVMNFLTCCLNTENNTLNMRMENNNLRIRSEELERTLNRMIEAKNHMEEELYKKLIVLLNSKKKKNRELKTKVECRSAIYDQSTDESETEFAKIQDNSISLNIEDPRVEFHKSVACKTHNLCKNESYSLEGLDGSNNESDESFVLKFSQSPSQEAPDGKITRIHITDQHSGDDLFSD